MENKVTRDSIIISDGAMGTYYSELTSDSATRVEEANIFDPETIRRIHQEYIDSGSTLIRTNTFAANTVSLNIDREKLSEIIHSACNIALSLSRTIQVAGNIGPIPEIKDDGTQVSREDLLEEYRYIIDCFIEKGLSMFNLETFSSSEYINEIISYIRTSVKNSFVMVQISINKSGVTRKGLYIEDVLRKINDADIIGLNCGSGPTHLFNIIKKMKSGTILSLYPNAGYPEVINQRTVFNSSPSYFAEILLDSTNFGVKIIGGCCGTTPAYIKALSSLIKGYKPEVITHVKTGEMEKKESIISNKNLIIAVEIDPPFKPDLTKVIECAKELKEVGAHIITVADSPSGRMRLNPITVAARIKRDVDIDVMPHICCRDRNLIALKSDILAAHTEEIRKILLITGDPIPQEERDIVKKVFNCNSVTLMKQVSEFNKGMLKGEEFTIGGALNLSSLNVDAQLRKMENKVDAGATLFLTQPIYHDSAINHISGIKKRDGVKILAGILPLVTYKNAQFLNNEFPGITIPDSLINRFSVDMDRDDAEEVGIQIAVETVNRLKNSVDGFYFITPFFRTGMIKEIIRRALS